MFNHFTVIDLLRVWRVCATLPRGYARNTIFWAVVCAVQKRGFIGDARRLAERTAPWSV